MTATNHVLTGAIIAVAIKNPPPAIILAFLTHFAMDAIPHFRIVAKNDHDRFQKRTFYEFLWGDLTLALLALIIVPIRLHSIVAWWLVVLCMVACAAPDLVWGWRLFLDRYRHIQRPKNRFSRFHTVIQWSETPSGLVVEIVWCAVALALIFTRH